MGYKEPAREVVKERQKTGIQKLGKGGGGRGGLNKKKRSTDKRYWANCWGLRTFLTERIQGIAARKE